jgi:amidase
MSAPLTAAGIAAAVRAGAPPADAVRAALERIADLDSGLGAFATVRGEHALTEAALLADRGDLARLPLAGVPVAVKDTVPVRGVAPWRDPSAPAHADHPMVTRLRVAGAVVVGTTTASDAGLWPMTDGRAPDGRLVVTRNPWNRDRSAGGSSGGAGAAVGAGLVPIAQGTDALGSIRIPAAACGLVGVKPGAGVVTPVIIDPVTGLGIHDGEWFGLAAHGALATTVEDAALLLSVLAGHAELAAVPEPPRGLRVAVSIRPPLPGVRTGRAAVRGVFEVAGALRRAGYEVARAELRYPIEAAAGSLARWTGAAAQDVDALPPDRRADPQLRTLRHAAVGRRLREHIPREDADAMRVAARRFMHGYDLLLTPSLAAPPPRALAWSRRSWAANVTTSLRYSGGFAGAWNLAGWPAVSVPAGHDEAAGVPLGAQLIGRPGDEPLLLGVAAIVERLRPWPRAATRKIRR